MVENHSPTNPPRPSRSKMGSKEAKQGVDCSVLPEKRHPFQVPSAVGREAVMDTFRPTRQSLCPPCYIGIF